MGITACPRCIVPKDQFKFLGTKKDIEARTRGVRCDDSRRQFEVKSARDMVYQKGYAVDSKSLDPHLKATSLTLNNVCISKLQRMTGNHLYPECVLEATFTPGI